MDEPRRLALQDIENNFETDTRIVELDFRDSRFLKELQDRGYKNIAGTGDVENFINFEVFYYTFFNIFYSYPIKFMKRLKFSFRIPPFRSHL